MKNKLLSLIQICIISYLSPLSAQSDFFKPGNEWYYGYVNSAWIPSRGYIHKVYEKDTVLNALTLHKVNATTYAFDDQNPSLPQDTFYDTDFYYESGDSISYYMPNGELKLLWINGLSAGSRFNILDYGETFTVFIDSTKEVVIDGIDVTKSWMHGGRQEIFGYDTIYLNQAGHDTLFSVFGPAGGFHFRSCWGAYDCFTPSLCRYISAETGLVHISGVSECDLITTSINESISSRYKIYPNPVFDLFNIEIPYEYNHKTWIQLFNQTGKQVFSTIAVEAVNEIDMTTLPSGIYYCIVKNEYGTEVIKVMKL